MKAAVIIAGGGIGKRMGADRPKQYLEFSGRPMLCHTLDRFLSIDEIKKIVVVLPSDFVGSFERDIVALFPPPLVGGGEGEGALLIAVAGGVKRQDSVKNGLALIGSDIDVVLVHDACRPFISKELITRSIDVAYNDGAAIVAAPIKETIKRVEGRSIKGTVDRQNLYGAQTPQSFRADVLKKAYEKAFKDGFYGTDDAMLVERTGGKVTVIEGDYRNIKITTPEDLIIAEALMRAQ